MGAQIAAHLANAGIPTLLLDIVPRKKESETGLPTSASESRLSERTNTEKAETRPLGRVPEADRSRPLGRVPEADRSRPLGGVQEPDRNRIARAGLEAAKKAKPAAFFISELASLVTVGNFEDDLPKLKDCDLIIEAVVENLEIKRGLFELVEQH